MKVKITLPWISNKDMRVLFSNIDAPPGHYYILAVFHKSRKGGFSRKLTIEEAEKILKKENPNYALLK